MLDRIRNVLGPELTAATVADILAKEQGDRVAAILDVPLPYEGFSGESLSYDQVRRFVARTAFVLETNLGIRRGDRVVVCTSGLFDELLVVLAAFRLGAVTVLLPADTGAAALAHALSEERAPALITDRTVWDQVVFDPPPRTLAFLGPAASAPEGAVSIDAALARSSAERDPEKVEGEQAIAIFRSSARSALSGGAVLTSEGLTARGRPLALVKPQRGAVGIAALPLADLTGFCSAVAALAAGVTLHHVVRFDAARALEAIERRRATAFFGCSWMYRAMADAGLDGFDLRSVRLWASATDRIPVELIGEFKRRGAMFRVGPWRTEAIFVDGYGTAELPGAAVLRLSPPGISRWDESVVGIPIHPFRAKVCDDAGHELGRAEAGELWIQGPGMGGPGADLTSDGWLRTGELASQDFLGLLHFEAARRSVIRAGGYTVQPAQIERALASHPAVESVLAFGVPHPTRREMPVAVVAGREGAEVEPDALLAWARERLADHKAPRRIWIVSPEDLPRGADREALRAALRRRYADTFLRL
ncbi:MAG: acyl--CoA ligase [Deltaproteobacteria bacterium]|nr:acyl--CoA ligase [Deltaproteobacteria bacterium]